MIDWIVAAVLMVGGLFSLVAAFGVVRMPDLFTRMQASTKSGTLGVGCTLLGAALYFHVWEVTLQALLVIAFVFLTAPIAAHIIGRAAYFVGVSKWAGTVIDELEDRYDPATHALRSTSPARSKDISTPLAPPANHGDDGGP